MQQLLSYIQTTETVRITVYPIYLESQSVPESNEFLWAYHISIENLGKERFQLRKRYWKITDGLGRIQEIWGDGVVGEEPLLYPGETFEYTSGTPLATPSGIMVGFYVMEKENGEQFQVEVPAFSLDSPFETTSINQPILKFKRVYMRPTREEAEAAVRTLISWAGDTPDREGLKETPSRVIKAFEEYFNGYETDPADYLIKTFEEVAGYDEVVLLRDVRFESHCEHHLAPIVGVAHVAYLPSKRVVGISKLARVVEIFAKRLQIQEKMTAEIANTIDRILQPQGVIVIIEANHHCMTSRGINKPGSSMVTCKVTGLLKSDDELRREIRDMIQSKNSFMR